MKLRLSIGEPINDTLFNESTILTNLAYRKFVASLFVGVQKQGQVQRIYRASTDLFTAAKFHQLCDGKGPTLTIIKATGDFIFGGYTTVNWDQSNSYKEDFNAFLFSVNNLAKYPIANTLTTQFTAIQRMAPLSAMDTQSKQLNNQINPMKTLQVLVRHTTFRRLRMETQF